MRLVFIVTVLLSLLWLFTACTSVATSVAASSAQVVYNHQKLEKNAADQLITLRTYQAIDIDSNHFRNANINVATLNRMVLLSGQAQTEEQKVEAEAIVKKIKGVQRVYNWLSVEKPLPRLTRLQDAWLTAKVKAKLLASGELDATQVKVVTEKHIVFLMGFLRPQEARAAVEAARSTSGVDTVVKLFYYLNLSTVPQEGVA